jgi:hypothetical protein
MVGDMPQSNVAMGSHLASLEQGLIVFQGVYGRIFRAFDKELRKLKELNRLYMDSNEYYEVLDDQPQVSEEELAEMMESGSTSPDMGMAYQTDYDRDDSDVALSASSTMSSEQVSMARLRLITEVGQAGGYAGKIPNPAYMEDLLMSALQLPNSEVGNVLVDAPPPQPDPKTVLEGQKFEHQRSIDWARVQIESGRVENEGTRNEVDALIRAEKNKLDAIDKQEKNELKGEENDLKAMDMGVQAVGAMADKDNVKED